MAGTVGPVPRGPGEFKAIGPSGEYLPGRGPLTYFHWYGAEVLAGLEGATYEVVKRVTQAAARTARRNHPWQSRTGQLEASIFAAEPQRRGNAIVGIWGAHFPALFLEYGTVKMPPYPFLAPAAAEAYHLANFAGQIRNYTSHSTSLAKVMIP